MSETNGHPSPAAFPLTPPMTPEPRPPTRHLVVELRDADSPDFVLDTEEPTDADIIAYVRAKNGEATLMVPEIKQWPMGAVAHGLAIPAIAIGTHGIADEVVTIRTQEEHVETYGRRSDAVDALEQSRPSPFLTAKRAEFYGIDAELAAAETDWSIPVPPARVTLPELVERVRSQQFPPGSARSAGDVALETVTALIQVLEYREAPR
jgi:hypothetical protein